MKGERGFTLVEALIAFAILAVTLVALYQALGTSVVGLARASRHDEAVLIAQSRLSELAALPLPSATSSEGDIEGTPYRWRFELIPDVTAEAPEIAASPVRLQKVKLTVSWDEGGVQRRISVDHVLLVLRQPGQ